MAEEEKRKGANWRPVKITGLSKKLQTAYKNFQAALEELKDGLTEEWNEKYPDGIDGKVISFNVVTGGKVMYMLKDKPKTKAKGVGDGDDVFSMDP